MEIEIMLRLISKKMEFFKCIQRIHVENGGQV